MPHLTLEYNISMSRPTPNELLMQLNQVLLASGQFEASDIKSRVIPLTHSLVGDGKVPQTFFHLTLQLLEGRDTATKQQLSQQLLATLSNALQQAHPTLNAQISCDVVELIKITYSKQHLLDQADSL